tara:strand:- start:1163 stop:1546 length:384 start_codon:yes stop_codon:yes gene_type:complete
MNKKTNLILIIIPLFFALIQTNFLRNSYELVNLNHQERIINAEGFCKKRGIGYINFIKKKYSINEKIKLITADKEPIDWAVFSSKHDQNINHKHIIIINYNNLKNKLDLTQFKIIDNFKDCYYLLTG